MRLLIVKLSALGDVIQTFPALKLFKKVFPEAEIDWIVDTTNAELLLDHPYLRKVFLFHKEFFKNPAKFINFLQGLRKDCYTAVIDFQGLLKSALLGRLARAKYRMGFSNHREGSPLFYNVRFEPYDPDLHAVRRYLLLVKRSVNFLTPKVEVNFSEDEIFYHHPLSEKALPFEPKRPYLILIPGARWETKLWPLEHWKTLLESSSDLRKKYDLYFIGGKKELRIKDFAEEMERDFAGVFSLVGKLSLKEVTTLMKGAELIVTVDTGTMHLASLLNRPILALFGPTSPARTGPWSKTFWILQENLPCAPCFKRRCHDIACMQGLLPERVKAKLKELLT